MELKEDDLVLCTVTKIEASAVFVSIEGNGFGTIAMSEVAAGRIRNLREYVAPNKKIVCKVFKISGDHAELSLRRVTAKERDEVLNKYKNEKTAQTILNNALKNDAPALKKISEKYTPYEFISAAKSDPSILQKFVSKEEETMLQKMLAEKKEREKITKKVFILKSSSSNGIDEIKKILSCKKVLIHYLGSSQFSIEAKGKDFKELNHLIDSELENIAKKAKEMKVHFELKET